MVKYTARSKQFWDGIDDCIRTDTYAIMIVLTGSELGRIVYERRKETSQFPGSDLQRSKFKSRWMRFTYSEAEICLMLLRQLAGTKWDRNWVPDDGDDPAASERQVGGQDAVLALALAIRDIPASSAWASTGQVVHPGLEAVHAAVQSYYREPEDGRAGDAAGSVLPDGAPAGRLTKQVAENALSDDKLMQVATRSKEKVMHRAW